jgi:lipopolysaccharide export system protein LptC
MLAAVKAYPSHAPAAPEGAHTGIRLRDRSLEFRRARRHSVLVRLLKIALPLLSFGIVSFYFAPSLLTIRIDGGQGEASVKSVTLEAGALKMMNPRLRGVNGRQGTYDVAAAYATQEAKAPDLMNLNTVNGKLVAQDGSVTQVAAPDGVYDNKLEEMTFNNGLHVVRDGGNMEAKLQTATVYMKSQQMVSKTPVSIRMDESTIDAQSMTLFMDEGRAVFEGAVKVHLKRQNAGEATTLSAPSGSRAAQ